MRRHDHIGESVEAEMKKLSGFDLQALRVADVMRLPQFKNKLGKPAHSEVDGSDWMLSAWSNAALGELGEAANLIKKIERGDLTLEEARPMLAKEMADVVIYADLLCYRAGIDLCDSIIDKFNEVSIRVGSSIRLARVSVFDQNAAGDETAWQTRLANKELVPPSEAIMAFLGWLSTQKQPVTIGSEHDCASLPVIATHFCQHQGWQRPRENYTSYLKSVPSLPEEQVPDQALLMSTTDASIWAREFMKQHNGNHVPFDEATMLCWFANLAEAARNEGRDEAHREYQRFGEQPETRGTVSGRTRSDAPNLSSQPSRKRPPERLREDRRDPKSPHGYAGSTDRRHVVRRSSLASQLKEMGFVIIAVQTTDEVGDLRHTERAEVAR